MRAVLPSCLMRHSLRATLVSMSPVDFRVKELEEQDPEYRAALDSYQRRLLQKSSTALAPLLLRINSVLHVREALPGLLQRVRSEYGDTVVQYGMDKDVQMAALDGAFDEESNVPFEPLFAGRC